MHTDIMCYDDIAQIAGKVPQHVIFIPEALSPNFSAPAVQIRNACRQKEQSDEEPLFTSACLFEPRGYDRDEQIYAYQRIHEP